MKTLNKIISISLALCLSSSYLYSSEVEESAVNFPETGTLYNLKKEDDFKSIALKYDSRVDWIKYANNIDDNCNEDRTIFLPQDANLKGLKVLAEYGDAQSQCSLGDCYERGLGVEENPSEALKWIGKAAEQNFPLAQYVLASYYMRAFGVEKNLDKAFELTKISAEQGFAHSQYVLGNYFYAEGISTEENLEEAFKWVKKAAEQGHIGAQFVLENYYMKGIGVEKNRDEAFRWAKEAAMQGDSLAQFSLSNYYLEEAFEKLKEAFKWNMKSAEQGLDMAQHSLGVFYYTQGLRLELDEEKAYFWLKKAADQAYPDSIEVLEKDDKWKKYIEETPSNKN